MDQLTYWIYKAFGLAVRPLSVAAAFRAGQVLGWLAYLVMPRYRRLALRNLRIAFSSEKSDTELRRLAHRHLASLCGNLLAGLKIARMSREEILGLVTLEGWEHGERLLAARRPMVATISHIGNWELIAQLMPLLLPPPLGTIYQRLGNPFIDAEIRASRAHRGVRLFERKEGFQAAIETLREGLCVGVLADQHAGDAGLWCPLFGRLASTSPLAATLALRTKSVVLTMAVHTVSPGRWRFVVDPPIETAGRESGELTAAINLSVERQVRRRPEDWLWGHNRWKTPRPKFLLATYRRGVVARGAGRDLVDLQPPQVKLAALQPFRILIRSSDWLGDAVMSIPAVVAIKQGRPDAHVTVLTPEKLAEVWRMVAEVDEVIAIPPGRSIFGVARSIRRNFEAVFLFPDSLRVALEAWLAGIPRRVGFAGHRRAWLLNQVFREKKKKAPPTPQHQAQLYLKLAQFAGAEIGNALAEGPLRPAPSTTGRRAPRMAVCPGAQTGGVERWLPERFAEVMTRVAAARPCDWILVGVARDAAIGAEITRRFQGTVRNLIGKTSMIELIAELRECDQLLTNDTGTMHLAALLGVPVVAIFGSAEPALRGPLGPGHRVVRQPAPSGASFPRAGLVDVRLMPSVTVEMVTEAILGAAVGAGPCLREI